MKTRITVALGTVLFVAPLAPFVAAQNPAAPKTSQPQGRPPAAERAPDEQAIKATFDVFSQAYQKGDAKTLSELFTPGGEAADAEGGMLQGREALLQHYTSEFSGGSGDQIKTSIESITFLDPSLARSTGTSEITPNGGGAPHHTRFHGLHLKRDGRWFLASVRELPDAELSPHEHLKQLEWLVGDWVEEASESVVFNSYRWSDDKNTLLRTFDLRVKGKPALTGTQRIAWDPLTKQIKSWLFDSRGGYSDALWVREGNQWLIKATGVRNDGRIATATQVLTFVNNERLQRKSDDRTLTQEAESDNVENTMVRKPPEPKAARN